ncbi:receptor-type tyrosine-protein phosphatase eta-like isoform X2 [Leptopilina heterotoma]|uniref:receptor-type tyrosine-protein phosphatase eta-like isoform X2 n=1 Tax=Leptopilina heterotoma TaxID=63436 RepID=UPI001CA9D3A7|nr:receptor-type tyrosine-protein phosphatase eta-like isoform X2 [Leptopilina heterotoma]
MMLTVIYLVLAVITRSGFAIVTMPKLKVTEISESSCKLMWTKPIDSKEPMNYTLVRSQIGEKNVSYYLYENVLIKYMGIDSLQPGTLYTFTLYAKLGNMSLTPISTTCHTKEFLGPKLLVKESTESSCKLMWTKPINSKQAVNYTLVRSQIREKKVSYYLYENVLMKYMEIDNLEPETLYKFTLYSKLGSRNFNPASITCHTGIALVPKLQVTEISKSSCKLMWTKPIDSKEPMNYTLVRSQIGEDNVSYHFYENVLVKHMKIDNLEPKTLYNFTLYAKLGKRKFTPISRTCLTKYKNFYTDTIRFG